MSRWLLALAVAAGIVLPLVIMGAIFLVTLILGP
jgi:hypothetical protein